MKWRKEEALVKFWQPQAIRLWVISQTVATIVKALHVSLTNNFSLDAEMATTHCPPTFCGGDWSKLMTVY